MLARFAVERVFLSARFGFGWPADCEETYKRRNCAQKQLKYRFCAVGSRFGFAAREAVCDGAAREGFGCSRPRFSGRPKNFFGRPLKEKPPFGQKAEPKAGNFGGFSSSGGFAKARPPEDGAGAKDHPKRAAAPRQNKTAAAKKTQKLPPREKMQSSTARQKKQKIRPCGAKRRKS